MTSPDQAELSRRARNLVEFLRRLTQMRTLHVRDVGEYEEVVWFASVPDMVGSHCVTHDGHAADADWIAIERPRIPQRPQAPAMLWGWLVDDADSTAEPALRDPDEGEELTDDVVAAYDQYLDAWRDWTAKYGPRVPLLALYERLFRIKQQADQLGERFETVVAAGLALVPGGERGRVRRHLVTMRAEVHYEPQTGRITVRPAPDGIDVQFEDDMLDPALVPHKEGSSGVSVRGVASRTMLLAQCSPCATVPGMERIPVRELRNQASQVVRRARAGERLVITVDGVPAAEIGPVGTATRAGSLDELIATGAVVAARARTAAPEAKPVPAPAGRSSSDVLRQLRER